MKDVIALYNKKRSFFADLSALKDNSVVAPDLSVHKKRSACLERSVSPDFCAFAPIAIVIPACDEFPGIFDTLDSIQLSINKSVCLDKSPCRDNSVQAMISIIIVVNNRHSASQSIKQNNQQLLQWYKNRANTAPFCAIRTVIIIDCASEGSEIPEGQGVGWARKYGMDYALLCGAKVIACMDADTLVSENYASELLRFLGNCRHALAQKKKSPSGAVLNFTHQKADDDKTQKSIAHYEFFMKEHSASLKKTGTPYYPWALGPSIICSAQGYAASGGMNKRLAGEDFYFLQALVKLHIQQMAHNSLAAKNWSPQLEDFPLLDCTVYPQARFSDRVLFGTGKKLQAIVEGEDSVSLYPKSVYEKIACLLQLFLRVEGKPDDFLRAVKTELADVWEFLEKENFFVVWEKLYRQNNSSATKLYTSFHSWFDGLKILRLIHFLTR